MQLTLDLRPELINESENAAFDEDVDLDSPLETWLENAIARLSQK